MISPATAKSSISRRASITIHALRLVSCDRDHAVLEAECGKGTYVRAIARDLGRALGCFGHVTALRRTRVGPFAEADSAPLAELMDAPGTGAPGPARRRGGPDRTALHRARPQRRRAPAARPVGDPARTRRPRRGCGLCRLLRRGDRLGRRSNRANSRPTGFSICRSEAWRVQYPPRGFSPG